MYIKELNIAGFGRWENISLDFNESNQLIYGGNEAGKTSIFNFIRVILFGFDALENREHYKPHNPASKYGGSLVLIDEKIGAIGVTRFYGEFEDDAILSFANGRVYGQTAEEDGAAMLKKIIYPLNLELFDQVYAVGDEKINSLSELTADKIQDALMVIGTTGSTSLLRMGTEYRKNANSIYAHNNPESLLNQKIIAFQQNEEAIMDAMKDEEKKYQLKEEVNKLDLQADQVRVEHLQLEEVLEHQRLQMANLPLYEEYLTLLLKNRQQGLSADEVEVLRGFYQEYQMYSQEIEVAQKQIDEARVEETDSTLIDFYRQHEDEIKSILKDAYTLTKDEMNLSEISSQIAQKQVEIMQYNNRWGWQMTIPPIAFTRAEKVDNQNLHAQLYQTRQQISGFATYEEGLNTELQQAKANLEAFENEYKAVFARERKADVKWWRYLLMVVGIAFMVIGSMIPDWKFKAPLYVVAVLCLLVGLSHLFSNFQQLVSGDLIKKEWNDLNQKLVDASDAVVKSSSDYDRLLATEVDIRNRIGTRAAQHNVGKYVALEDWISLPQEIDNYIANINYLHTLENNLLAKRSEVAHNKSRFDFLKAIWPIDMMTIEQRFTALRQFSVDMENSKLSEYAYVQSQMHSNISAFQRKLEEIVIRSSEYLKRGGIARFADIPGFLINYDNAGAIRERLNGIAGAIGGIFDLEKRVSPQEIRTYFEVQSKRSDKLHAQLAKIEGAKQDALDLIQTWSNDFALEALYQKKALLEDEIDTLSLEWGLDKVMMQILSDLINQCTQSRFPRILQLAKVYFNTLTAGNYDDIIVTRGKLKLSRHGNKFNVEEVSSATRAQLVMSLRLGYFGAIHADNIAPLIIDDGWLHYDSTRKVAFANLLDEISATNQVIGFTADKEMRDFYLESGKDIIDL
ncbi:MAG: AAA family ATPase [Lactobacillales bacterium]|jgi:uncharacterized protein YhaN|nr:AAA family ATPase [Lactobacillales bacterium]